MRPLGQLAVITIVAAAVTLAVNLAVLPRLVPVGSPTPVATTAPAGGGQIPVALRTVTDPAPGIVTLPTRDPRAPSPTAILAGPPRLAQAGPGVGNGAGASVSPTQTATSAGPAPCQTYPLSEVLAEFRRAGLPLRDSLFDPAYPGTDQPFPLTARVADYARGVSALPGLRLDVFVLPDEGQVRALQGDAGRWALSQRRQVRVFPYRNIALVSCEADPARAVAYERALVQLP